MTIIYSSYYTYVHMVLFYIQDSKSSKSAKSSLIQTTGVYILSGSAEIISDWMIRSDSGQYNCLPILGLMPGDVLSSSEHSV